MKKPLLLLLVCQISILSQAQITTPYVEIAVDEIIELKVKQATLNLAVVHPEIQLNDEMMDKFDYSEQDYQDDEDEYRYEELASESPKKVTKEMKQAHTERRERILQRNVRTTQIENNFKASTNADIIRLLSENNITYTLVDLSNDINSEYAEDHDYEEAPEEDYGDEYYREEFKYYGSDTVVRVIVNNEIEIKKIEEILSEIYLTDDFSDFVYETIDDHLETVLPKLSEKAKRQAAILAKSLDKRLGKILYCSNAAPSTNNISTMRGIYNAYSAEEDPRRYDSPFHYGAKKDFIQFVYRFALIP